LIAIIYQALMRESANYISVIVTGVVIIVH